MKPFNFFYGYIDDDFSEITLPLMTRVVAERVLTDLVEVRPLQESNGILYYIDYSTEQDNIIRNIRNNGF
jgi:hypothetical protein